MPPLSIVAGEQLLRNIGTWTPLDFELEIDLDFELEIELDFDFELEIDLDFELEIDIRIGS